MTGIIFVLWAMQLMIFCICHDNFIYLNKIRTICWLLVPLWMIVELVFLIIKKISKLPTE